jgi:glycosyltransferase involved in cell wall biosynthesis
MPKDSSDISVVVLNSYCHAQGGASRVAIDAAVGLANKGADVTFLGAVGPICDELSSAPLKTICLMQRDLINAQGSAAVVLRGLWNVPAHRALGKVLERLDSAKTVVHLHGFAQALSASPVRCALSRGYKVLCTLHEFFCACPTGGFFDFVSNEPCPRRALSLDCITTNCDKRRYAHKLYRVARSLAQIQLGRLPKDVKDYVGLSRRSVEMLRPYLPPDAQIHLVPNPVEVPRSAPVRVAQNRKIVLVGRLDEEKGIRVLVQAALLSGTQLTLVGDGPLRAYAEASGLCRVTGWVSRDAVLAELQSARCLVFPSSWYETFGLVVEEAAARGIPAIVSDISAAAERVVDGVTGWHMRAGDSADLARCLNIVKDDAAVEAAGASVYMRWWLDPLTRDRHVERLLQVYTDMLVRVDDRKSNAGVDRGPLQ